MTYREEFAPVSFPGRDVPTARTFIIEEDGRHYVAVAVLEYDPGACRTDEEREGVEQIARLYERSKGGLERGAVAIELDPGITAVQTNPPTPTTPPRPFPPTKAFDDSKQ
ncbi:MAG TPA: hypothetical protein VES64_09185 [Allosphingosinicella sp.]|nr:hypothetical protein [Allosphingosinicella sp.]